MKTIQSENDNIIIDKTIIGNALSQSHIGSFTFIQYIQTIKVIVQIIRVKTVSLANIEFIFMLIKEL